MTWLEALILGIIQGLTEFLPVSSSGHLELGKAILGVAPEDPLLFSIVLHGATALSTIIVFRKDILQLITGMFRRSGDTERKYILMIVISMIPVGIVGVLFESQIETLFEGKVLFVGCMLLFTALLLFISERIGNGTKPVNFFRAFIVGLAQAVAILPGISRSGATISTALMLNIKREDAARFSFLMVLPPILGAVLLKVKDYMELDASAITGETVSSTTLIVGFSSAFISGILACRWMIEIVKKSKLIYFVIYCTIVGLIAIIFKLF